ncbi:MAG: hypothetical protein KDA44_03365 [Planctomycetales bacterium]|nr:hypothetical protein [Planctomycetales bacterium]
MIRWTPQTVTDWRTDADALRTRRYGVIETVAGQLVAVHLRPWPKWLSWRELWPAGDRYHPSGDADRCRLYFNQPLGHGNFLALKYVATTAGTSYATFLAALQTLDAIAALKGTDALLCDVQNRRISDRLLARLGWEAHKPSRWHRNFIKRFYGAYPAAALCAAQRASESHAAVC